MELRALQVGGKPRPTAADLFSSAERFTMQHLRKPTPPSLSPRAPNTPSQGYTTETTLHQPKSSGFVARPLLPPRPRLENPFLAPAQFRFSSELVRVSVCLLVL